MDELAALVEQVPDEVLDYIEFLETRVEKAEAQIAGGNESDVAFEKALDDLDPEVAKAIIEQRERLEKAEAALQAEQIAKASAEWVQKARSADGLIDNPEEFGEELRQVAAVSPELADSIMSKLQAASERVAKSSLFAEMGHSAPASGSAAEKIQTIAKALVEADPTKTQAQAEAEAWEANPGLYNEHVAERQAAGR